MIKPPKSPRIGWWTDIRFFEIPNSNWLLLEAFVLVEVDRVNPVDQFKTRLNHSPSHAYFDWLDPYNEYKVDYKSSGRLFEGFGGSRWFDSNDSTGHSTSPFIDFNLSPDRMAHSIYRKAFLSIPLSHSARRGAFIKADESLTSLPLENIRFTVFHWTWNILNSKVWCHLLGNQGSDLRHSNSSRVEATFDGFSHWKDAYRYIDGRSSRGLSEKPQGYVSGPCD